MKTTIGGDRLGSGNKQQVSMKTYNRSTHDLSYLWRSSMASGTLVPFMSEVGLPGDSFDIDLNASVLTLPTVGPLFGSYKVQLDVFSCPIRLYQGKLHMNKLGIGMNMSNIKLPQIKVESYYNNEELYTDNSQINASSILSYLNIRGLGIPNESGFIEREFNALPYLAYWDIYKQYYANKQEENGVMIHNQLSEAIPYDIEYARIRQNKDSDWINFLEPLEVEFNFFEKDSIQLEIKLNNGHGLPNLNRIRIKLGTAVYYMTDKWNNLSYENNNIFRWTGTTLYQTGLQNVVILDQQIPALNDFINDGTPQLYKFPLENIDTMRENILSHVKEQSAFVIDYTTIAPYGKPLYKTTIEGGNVYSIKSNQEGLGIKTYQSDLFNNWISTEWIDGDNGINEVTKVSTADDGFTIDALNLANKVYNMLNRIAISGGTYDDWLDAVYTHERSKSVENPIYMGSLIKELSFEEVISTADTSGENPQPLGTLAGRGTLGNKHKGGKIKIKIDEPSYIMGIVSITPKVDYSQGNKWDGNLKTMNDFHKPALDEIGYQDLITDQMAWFDTKIGADGKELTFNSAGKQPAWINYMTNVNQVRGNFAEQDNSMFMVLNRRYEQSFDGISDLTTYIDPSKFNHIFADTRLDAQNFWVQISNKITARRKMSAKVIPNL